MFADWIRWLWSRGPDELLLLAAPLLLFDGLRYVGGVVALWLYDVCEDAWDYLTGAEPPSEYAYCPTVCVVLAGLNEADTIASTLESVWGGYPRLEIIVVDDGSSDGMAAVAEAFAGAHAGVRVLRKPQRGGKSSALNFALPFTQAEVLVCVDTDSHLGENAIWEVIQPLADPQVAAASGTVISRNAFTNLCTRLQSFEYLRSILLGRMFAARLGILSIVSGAFGAFRREALVRCGGWDVGPGEDGDLVLRLRKQGYRIEFTPAAVCCTNLPTTFKRLFFQRRRWEWAVVTFLCRKHIDLADPRQATFRWSNLILLLEAWTYSIFFMYGCVLYSLWYFSSQWRDLYYIGLTLYALYLVLEVLQWLLILYYSRDRARDFWVGLVFPLMPLYYVFLKAASLLSITEEALTRRSFRDNFVPERVRNVTWKW